MNSKPSLTKIKQDLSQLGKFEVVIYGSYVSDDFTSRSDIDIAVITRETNPDKNKEIWKNILKKINPIYHLNIFELLPLQLKAEIMDRRIILFGDKLELSEYFYHFKKLWKDVKPRYLENQFSHFKEQIKTS